MGVIARCPVMHLASSNARTKILHQNQSFYPNGARQVLLCLPAGGRMRSIYGCQQRHAALQSQLYSAQCLLYGTHYPGVLIHARLERGTLVHRHATRISHIANRIVQR